MRSVFYLGTCSTCTKIIKELNLSKDFELRDIKKSPMSEEEVDLMAKMAGSYEAIFSRKAMKYRALGLHEKQLSEKDYRQYILQEYTFLKRPVCILDDKIFVGNTKKVVSELAETLSNE